MNLVGHNRLAVHGILVGCQLQILLPKREEMSATLKACPVGWGQKFITCPRVPCSTST